MIGGSAGMGLETARRAREEGAEVILTGRNAEHLKQAGADVGARDVAAFDATDPAALGQFLAGLPIGRVVGPADIARLAVDLMINTAVTGATCAIDGGEQLVPGS